MTELMLIKSEDRLENQQLAPIVREKVLSSLDNYLRELGYININEIARQLGVQWETAKSLVDEVVSQWALEDNDQWDARIKFIENKVLELDRHPERFGYIYEEDRIAFRLGLLNQADRMRALKRGDKVDFGSVKDMEAVFDLHVWGSIKPRTRRAIQVQDNATAGGIKPVVSNAGESSSSDSNGNTGTGNETGA